MTALVLSVSLAATLLASTGAPQPPKATAQKAATKPKPASATPPASPPASAPATAAMSAAPPEGPEAARDGRLLVEQKCGKCHDVSLAFRSRLTDAHWKLHMKRMANRPGAAISDDQARRIHAYLKSIAAHEASR